MYTTNTCFLGIVLRLAAMALLRYTAVLLRRNAELPDPAGPLSSFVPSTAIEQANATIARCVIHDALITMH